MAISKVGVLGCGLMGHGISQICAQAGWDVVVREIDQAPLDKGMGKVEKQLARAVEKGKLEQADADAVRGRITTTLDYSGLADCDLVTRPSPRTST
jgi:3-hydroxyacyl-CoA dehydrogenase